MAGLFSSAIHRLAGSLAEQDVVIRIGIERRVEIDKVNAGVGKHLRIAQPLEIVTEQEAVHAGEFSHRCPRMKHRFSKPSGGKKS